ncbi:diol dehydratase small subunit [Planotetraspora mira]|jgi:propanediol dehydratase small subunit|uniref:Glycerol dehydrogenase n=1 Tax=Planotetraspora mira TaxID=58121 RepID=A0A8J3TQ41_9ACTN|nr:diol dehydratase small subunit [Planotetraspora mira]GII29987.1 glycerol dehydrogenase [Planotetraspora mira]
MTPAELDPQHDYPLASRRPELIRTPTGKRLDEITMRAVLDGEVVAEDLRIAAETLRLQARIADSVGRPQLGQNFRRAAEMTALPDEEVLRIYNALRPGASTKQELAGIAEELERDHSATLCARLIREAAEVYERRGILAG